MKQSRYNIFVEIYPDEVVVFNGVSKKFFTLSSKNIPELKAILDAPDNYANKVEYVEFLSLLKDNGFLIKKNTNELYQLRELFETYKEAEVYSLMILTTYVCNFSCWYCVQRHKKEYLNTETIEKIKKHISKYLIDNNLKAFHISWFGGEPLLNFEAISDICIFAQDFCSKHGISFTCGITTNGSLITEDMAISMKNLGFRDFQITIDGSKEMHNKIRYNNSIRDSFTEILDNIKILIDAIPNVCVTLRYNYTLKNLDEMIVEQINTHLSSSKDKIEILFRKVWQEPDSTELSNKVGAIMGRFIDNGYRIIHDYDNIKLTSCYVEQTHYNAIFPDGTVDKCSNKDISETRGFITESGDIMWEPEPTETKTNIFNYSSECVDCRYLPLCMGPCPANRASMPHDKICCYYEDRDQIFLNDIKNFVIITRYR